MEDHKFFSVKILKEAGQLVEYHEMLLSSCMKNVGLSLERSVDMILEVVAFHARSVLLCWCAQGGCELDAMPECRTYNICMRVPKAADGDPVWAGWNSKKQLGTDRVPGQKAKVSLFWPGEEQHPAQSVLCIKGFHSFSKFSQYVGVRSKNLNLSWEFGGSPLAEAFCPAPILKTKWGRFRGLSPPWPISSPGQ
ncbi:hypothetical protein GWK47_046725 [Chionoecetes opilio]|uniref:Uncharacterized protein n=1 Tax=Chionoecetes opilio TaxID=41210 RepID=A0A8J5CX21_CHIOP|nr:hypothetical protein GWK47_046725 [Chionoecetes opilio]